jgi:predicted Rossmann fold nucleotide-binding protein DprA/Smf involved in DNA uptake
MIMIPKGNKIAIVGSRDYDNLRNVRLYVLSLPEGTIIVSGGARGVDQAAERAAKERDDMQTLIYKADWESYGKSAGYRRNITIVDQADWIVAFWDGKSKGTLHTITEAAKRGKEITINPFVYDPGY